PVVVYSLAINYQVWHFFHSSANMIPWGLMSAILMAYYLIYLPSPVIMLGLKYRRLNETEKRRVRLIFVALAFVVVVAVPVVLISFGGALSLSPLLLAVATLAGVGFPLCFAYAILRHRLFDIRVIIRQGIRYAAAK